MKTTGIGDRHSRAMRVVLDLVEHGARPGKLLGALGDSPGCRRAFGVCTTSVLVGYQQLFVHAWPASTVSDWTTACSWSHYPTFAAIARFPPLPPKLDPAVNCLRNGPRPPAWRDAHCDRGLELLHRWTLI